MYSTKRPKLQISKTKSEIIWNVIGYTSFLFSIILLITIWGKLPQEVPAHYNAAGEVDRWGSKWELLILPVMGGFTCLLMFSFEKYPEIHNYPKRFNESNAAAFYLHSRKLINQLKNLALIVFSLLLFETISVAMDWGINFGAWLLPVLLIPMLLPIIISIYQQKKIV